MTLCASALGAVFAVSEVVTPEPVVGLRVSSASVAAWLTLATPKRNTVPAANAIFDLSMILPFKIMVHPTFPWVT
jgi:hypothetical protein